MLYGMTSTFLGEHRSNYNIGLLEVGAQFLMSTFFSTFLEISNLTTVSLMRVMSSRTGKPSCPKLLSSWQPTSESSCQERPFRWAAVWAMKYIWPVKWFFFPCVSISQSMNSFPPCLSPEQCLGALVVVWLPHAGLPWDRTPVCCSLR